MSDTFQEDKMNNNLFEGQLVRLTSEDPETLAEANVRWRRNTEFSRLLNRAPAEAWSVKKIKDWIEQDIERDEQQEYFFDIRTLEDDRLIGFLGLFGFLWNHGEAMVAIGIGEPESWCKGYGRMR